MLTQLALQFRHLKILVLLGVTWAACIGVALASDGPAQCTFCSRAEAFMKLRPEERVRTWFTDMNKGTSATGLSAKDDAQLLTSLGLDTVPTLSGIVRAGSSNQQIDAVSLLCDMDRFVPMAELPVPEPFGHVGPYLGYGYRGLFLGQPYERYYGEYNPYFIVDGRRIGPEGLVAVLWAASQTSNKSLRTFARDCSGLVFDDLRQLGTIDLLAAWRKAVNAGQGYRINLKNEFLPVADGILIQRAEESIPLLARVVLEDKDQEVRLHARQVLLRIDLEKVRLRGSEAGNLAITALRESARRHPLIEWRTLARTSKPSAQESHREFIEAVDNQTMKDAFLRGEPPFGWLARAFADLYGDDTTFSKRTALATFTVVKPDFNQFIAYLTRIDPAFPGWGCSNTAIKATYMQPTDLVRPCFKARVEHLHKYWVEYRTATQSKLPSPQ